MMYNIKSVSVIILTLAMLFSFLSIPASAEYTYGNDSIYEYRFEGGEVHIKNCITGIIGNVVIPSFVGGYPVTEICDTAFLGCDKITALTIPKSVNYIASDSFNLCTSLEAFIVEDGNLFYKTIDGVLFDNAVSVLIKYPFAKDGEYTVPDGVREISDYAFSNCEKLTRVNLPESTFEIDALAFWQNPAIEQIEVDTDNGSFTTENGILYNKDKTAIIRYPAKKGGEFTIPQTVKEVSDYAFYACRELTKLDIPQTVSYIGNFAFPGCEKIKAIKIPKSINEISNYSFLNCTALEQVEIESGTTVIGVQAFSYCTSLTEISLPETVTQIKASAFYACEKLETINIPDSVNRIGNNAFNETKWMSAQEKNAVVYVGKVAYKYNGEMPEDTEITLKSDALGVADNAFYGFATMKAINLPNGLKVIGASAFSGCTGMLNLAIPDGLEWLGVGAFSNCKKIKSVTIPAGIKTISMSAFSHCEDLETVSISSGVEVIGSSAFSNCEKLTEITLPDTVTDINDNAFYKCTLLSDIHNIENVYAIGYNAISNTPFYNSFPVGMVYIGSCAYKYKGNAPQNTRIIFPKGIKSISAQAFNGCEGISKIYISSQITHIGEEAFNNCKDLTEISVDSANESFSSVGGILYSKDKKQLMACPEKFSGVLVLPESVEQIEKYAFYNCTGILNITIHENLKSITDYTLGFYEKLSDQYRINRFTLYHFSNPQVQSYAVKFGFYGIDLNTVMLGELNGNGEVDAADALLVLQYSVGKIDLNTTQQILSDVDRNADVTSADALAVLQYSVGVIDSLININ